MAVAALILVASLILVACGGNGGGPSSGERDQTSSSPASTSAAEATQPTGAGPEPSADDQVGQSLTDLDLDLEAPIDLTHRPSSSSLIVAERAGRIVEVVASGEKLTAVSEPILDLSERVGEPEGERGLLGIAVSADGSELYASYTDDDGNSRIDAYTLDGNDGSLRADPASRRELVFVEQPYPNHNGGSLAVGPDGMLYAGFGDGGSADDPEGRAQDPNTLLGKVLRLDPTGRDDADGDGIPDDNPFVTPGGDGPDSPGFAAEPEIWLTGVRNPWRISFDRDDLWIADVGQNEVEEINRLVPDGATPAGFGANLGWDLFEGDREFARADLAPGGASDGPFTRPVFTYAHGPGCSVTGGYVVRDDRLAGWDGTYLFSDFCDPTIRTIREVDGRWSEVDTGITGAGSVVSFGRGPEGELYVLTLDAGVFRVDPAG